MKSFKEVGVLTRLDVHTSVICPFSVDTNGIDHYHAPFYTFDKDAENGVYAYTYHYIKRGNYFYKVVDNIENILKGE